MQNLNSKDTKSRLICITVFTVFLLLISLHGNANEVQNYEPNDLASIDSNTEPSSESTEDVETLADESLDEDLDTTEDSSLVENR